MADDVERSGVEFYVELQDSLQKIGQFVEAFTRIPGVMGKAGKAFDASSVQFDTAAQRYKARTEEGKVQYIKAAAAARVFSEQVVDSMGKVVQSSQKLQPSISAAKESVSKLGESSRTASTDLIQMGDVTKNISELSKKLGVDIFSTNEKIARSADSVLKAHISQEGAVRRLAKAMADLKKPNADAEAAQLRVANAQDQLKVATIRVAQTKRAYQRAVESASKSTSKAGKTTFQFAQNLGFLQIKAKAAVTATGTQLTGTIKAFGATLVTASKPLLVMVGLLTAIAGAGLVAVKTLGLMKKAFSALLAPVRAAIDKIKTFTSRALAVATGILFRDTLRSIVNQLRELSKTALQTAVSFEALTVRMEVLIARLVRAEKLTSSYADTMSEAADRAQGMLRWIQQLAMTAPIDVEDIATVSSLALAFGWTEDQAKTLTKTVAMFTAGMGLGSEHMQRIIFNFGQMKAAAKVTGTEIRDLVRGSFFPMIDVLDEAARQLGLTGEGMIELRKMAAEGVIPTDVFFKAFIDVVERDFPDALERMGRTMQGVMTRAKSLFKTLVGYQMLGPIIDRLSDSMANFLDKLATKETLNNARMIGRAIEKSYDLLAFFVKNNLIPAFKDLANAIGLPVMNTERLIYIIAWLGYASGRAVRVVSRVITSIAEKIRTTIESIESGAYGWGYNIIVTLARGIASATRWVVNAINVVSKVIAKWFAPGSPPLALPKLPEWGANAMLEFLRGFALADFSVLGAIQRPIRDALAMFVDLGAITKEQMARVYADLSKDVAKAISTGIFEENLFKRIAAQTGEFGEEIALLARRQIELAGAIREVEESERRLEEARKREERAGIKVNRQIREYNQLLRKGADKNVLKLKLDQINATEQERLAAKEAKAEAEEQVDVAKEQLKIIEDIARAQQELVNQLIEITRLFIDAQQAAAGGVGAPPEDWDDLIKFPDPDEVDPLPNIEEELNKIFAQAMKSVDDFFAEWEKKWNNFSETYLDPLTEAWGNIGKSLEGAWTDHISPTLINIETGWKELRESEEWEQVKGVFLDVYMFIANEAQRWSKEATRWWGEHGWALEKIVENIWKFLNRSTLEGLDEQIALHEEKLAEKRDLWQERYKTIREIVNAVWEQLISDILNWGEVIGRLFEAIALAMEGDWRGAWASILKISDISWNEIRGSTEAGGEETSAAAYTAGVRTSSEFERGVSGLGESLPATIQQAGERSWAEFYSSMKTLGGIAEETNDEIEFTFKRSFDDIRKESGIFIDDLEHDFGLLRDRVVRRSIVPDMMNDIFKVMRTGFNDTIKEAGTKLDNIVSKFVTFSKDAGDKWATFWSQIIPDAVTNNAQNVLDAVGDILLRIINAFVETDWSVLGKAIVDGITSALTDGASQITEAGEDVAKALYDSIGTFLQMGSPSRLLIKMGEDAILSFAKGIQRLANVPADEMLRASKEMAAVARLRERSIMAMRVMPGSMGDINVNMGGVAINNQMDQAVFEARVVGVLRRLMR